MNSKEYYQLNKKEINEKHKIYAQSHKLEKARNAKKYLDKCKYIVRHHYSNGTMKCACCGEDDYNALTIDHINNDGAQHRKQVSSKINIWLIKNNFPEGFQVLCFNCNAIKQFNGSLEYRKNKYNK